MHGLHPADKSSREVFSCEQIENGEISTNDIWNLVLIERAPSKWIAITGMFYLESASSSTGDGTRSPEGDRKNLTFLPFSRTLPT